MLQTKNIGIQTAIEEVRRMSMSERMRARYEVHMKKLRDRRANQGQNNIFLLI